MRILSGIMYKVSDSKDLNQVLILMNMLFNIFKLYSKYLKLILNQMDTIILCIFLDYQAQRRLHSITETIKKYLPFSCTKCDKDKKYISNLYYMFFDIRFRYILFIIFIVNIFYNILSFQCSRYFYDQRSCFLKIKYYFLEIHLMIHTGETKIICLYWVNYFTQKILPILYPEYDSKIIMLGTEWCSVDLENPYKIHTGEDLFLCQVCEKLYVKEDSIYKISIDFIVSFFPIYSRII